jgi:hypothetical protein
MTIFSFGLVFLGWGITVGIIALMGAQQGSPHPVAIPMTLISLLVGGALVGGAAYLNRRNRT